MSSLNSINKIVWKRIFRTSTTTFLVLHHFESI